MFKRLMSLLFLVAVMSVAMGQGAGKISGVVTDTETGEPLPGVNVVLKGTYLGASTDVDGFFVILNVPPGTYTVSFTYVGYQWLEVENVRVVSDLTKRLDITLSPTTLELDSAIVIVADRPFFETGATNTVRVLDSEEIERIPIKGVNSVVALNAGAVIADGSGGETGNATVNVRGGRGNETLFVIDGVPYNDLIFGNVTGNIPDNAVEQISSQFGGFSAKYGSAQSGVVNIVTKSGATKYFGSMEGVTSQATDDYGYSSVNASLGGPILPGNRTFSFFGSVEYIDSEDDNPKAVGNIIPSTTYQTQKLGPFGENSASGTHEPGLYVREFEGSDNPQYPENESTLLRGAGKLEGAWGKFKTTLAFNGSTREYRSRVNTYRKNNAFRNPVNYDDVFSTSLKFTHFIQENTVWDAIIRYKGTWSEQTDPIFPDNIEAWGDTLANQQMFPDLDFFRTRFDPITGQRVRPSQGSRVLQDDVGVFYDRGRVNNLYNKYEIQSLGLDLNFTQQLSKHLIEVGFSAEQNIVRYYSIGPTALSLGLRDNPATAANEFRSRQERYINARPFFYGYDLYGNTLDDDKVYDFTDSNGNVETILEEGAPKPILASAYIQDKIEFQDFILNAGLRWDYFDPDGNRLRDESDIFGGGENPNRLEPEDLEEMPAENYFSPRLGFAFPVTERTVFHAQYGVFRQAPRLLDVYDSWFSLERLESDNNRQANNGYLQSEKTTQYEFGFKHQFGNVASLDVTAYYKNVEGLTNVVRKLYVLGQITNNPYLTTDNTDFGTVRGLAFGFNLRRLGPVSTKVDYALEVAEGTGSSQSSSFNAAFRNTNGETPKSIAPLDFDQTHTFTANVDIRAGKGEGPALGNLRLLENAGANFLISYNSGRPYTPLAFESVLPGAASNQGEVTQFINSARQDGIFRIDMRVDKQIPIAGLIVTPYLVVRNLLDRDNFNTVYQSTGEPDNTAWLETAEGAQTVRGRGNEVNQASFISDYRALERNPANYGIPRLIRLGVSVKF